MLLFREPGINEIHLVCRTEGKDLVEALEQLIKTLLEERL